jgi:aspartyl-tRNA(Asn)/glutamyl-tRNA(Gln) amidotransferase subunit C
MTEAKKIDRARVEHTAKLASLSIAPDEAAKLAEDLSAIVDYVAQLDALDTSSVEPTADVQLTPAAWREDVLVPGLSHEEALSQAPRVEDAGFAVPVFVE